MRGTNLQIQRQLLNRKTKIHNKHFCIVSLLVVDNERELISCDHSFSLSVA